MSRRIGRAVNGLTKRSAALKEIREAGAALLTTPFEEDAAGRDTGAWLGALERAKKADRNPNRPRGSRSAFEIADDIENGG
ncbi:hypothetical protein ABTY59_32245 [Streptomyces sp. NPDC096079]|uniref:hypothetical protein n=1 Tax=Streptomyces sp. NPDC096079 TaxID=3155820 RepID=UPI00331B3CFB